MAPRGRERGGTRRCRSEAAPGLAFTGSNPIPLAVLGAALFIGAWTVRRRLLRKRTRVVLREGPASHSRGDAPY